MSLSAQAYPQPISRPSTNPFSIIRKTIEELIQAPAACNSTRSSVPEPTFLGLEERKRQKLEQEHDSTTEWIEVLEFDLDEDGPLPDEYLPKRRISVKQSAVSSGVKPLPKLDVTLPTPAKWSPAGDEPISRKSNRFGAPYLAVQPPIMHALPAIHPPSHTSQVPPRHRFSDGIYANRKLVNSNHACGSPPRHLEHREVAHHAYPHMLHVPGFHSRSYSQSYEREDHRIGLTVSQSRFNYNHGDTQMTVDESRAGGYFDPLSWGNNRRHQQSMSGFSFALPHQLSWLRV